MTHVCEAEYDFVLSVHATLCTRATHVVPPVSCPYIDHPLLIMHVSHFLHQWKMLKQVCLFDMT